MIVDDIADVVKEKESDSGSASVIQNSLKKTSLPRGYIAPGIVAYYPATYKKDAYGRLVCEKRNDRIGISTQDKPVHIDMECCLDPDEIPNPYCYYSRERYGRLLSDYERKKEKFFRKYLERKKL